MRSAAIWTGSPERASLIASRKDGASWEALLLRGGVAVLDVVVENLEEFGDDLVALESELERAVHEDGRFGFLEGARQRDADVRVLALARAVDHTAHDRDLQLLHTRLLGLPPRHLGAEIGLDLLARLLEEGRGRPAAAGAGRHLGQKAPQAHGLEDLLGDEHLFGPIAAGLGRERH